MQHNFSAPTYQAPVHVSSDLETLSLQPNAVILSVGLAAFTIMGGVVKTFYTELDKDEQIGLYKRHVMDSTLQWWQKQSPEAAAVFHNKGMAVKGELERMTDWFKSLPNLAGVWGFGADFDNAALQSLFRDYGMQVPWPYKLNRCGRTITALLPQRKPPNVGTKHNALDDATYQAMTIRDSLMKLSTLTEGGQFL